LTNDRRCPAAEIKREVLSTICQHLAEAERPFDVVGLETEAADVRAEMGVSAALGEG